MNDMQRGGAWWGALAISTLLAACGGGDDAPPADTTPPAATPLSCTQLRHGDPGSFDRSAVERRRRVHRSGDRAQRQRRHRHSRVLSRQRQHLSGRQHRTQDSLQSRVAYRLERQGSDVRRRRLQRHDSEPCGQRPERPDQPADAARTGYANLRQRPGHQANASARRRIPVRQRRGGSKPGGDAIKKTHDAAIFLINARHAAGAPDRAYFAGGSTGGREAGRDPAGRTGTAPSPGIRRGTTPPRSLGRANRPWRSRAPIRTRQEGADLPAAMQACDLATAWSTALSATR